MDIKRLFKVTLHGTAKADMYIWADSEEDMLKEVTGKTYQDKCLESFEVEVHYVDSIEKRSFVSGSSTKAKLQKLAHTRRRQGGPRKRLAKIAAKIKE